MSIGKQPSTNSTKGKYLSQFPTFFHPYIDDIVDVEPNRNYGFRCISSALGWGKMHVMMFEDSFILKSSNTQICFPSCSMTLSLIYSVVFVYLSMLMNIRFSLLLIAPSPYTSRHTIIVVAFVNRNHLVQVKLRSDCPLPPVTDCWKKNCSNNAKAWETAYAGRFRHCEELSRK
ncbi:uncharacterized protein LOC131613482 [Vicia villosa]|uniref:uncharacterized protein LOC131613482 n=1 Tax=Vicia villosa TaxID=3911 RepID=UPI00273C44C1|nr:uncharacterized protein LOC131613482 [Vicia villosa]